MTHRLITHNGELRSWPQRSGKNSVSKALAENYAREGEHVHLGLETCYNGGEDCMKLVEVQFHWDGAALVPPGGKTC